MQINMRKISMNIRSSFWFIPMLLSIGAIISAYFIIELDSTLRYWGMRDFLSVLNMPIETARQVLSTIAGAMISVASLVFSMTLVALILVSQQLGPRILVRFMDDRPTQIILGLFNATFLFSLLILMRIDSDATAGEVPGLSVAMSLILTIASIAMLIHFIHHISTRIQADVIIADLGNDFSTAVSQFVSTMSSDDFKIDEQGLKWIDQQIEESANCKISLNESGYVQQLNNKKACDVACEHDLLMKLEVLPGEFVLAGTPVLTAYSKRKDFELNEEEIKNIRACFSVAQKRTPEASINFEINALTEVALRALSPGINDPQTAISCVNKLSEGLAKLMDYHNEQQVVKDSDNQVRIIHPIQHFDCYLNNSFKGIVDTARDNPMVLEHIIRSMDQLEYVAQSFNQRVSVSEFTETVKKLLNEQKDQA